MTHQLECPTTNSPQQQAAIAEITCSMLFTPVDQAREPRTDQHNEAVQSVTDLLESMHLATSPTHATPSIVGFEELNVKQHTRIRLPLYKRPKRSPCACDDVVMDMDLSNSKKTPLVGRPYQPGRLPSFQRLLVTLVPVSFHKASEAYDSAHHRFFGAAKPSTFRFLDLPAEIRNIIYSFVSVEKHQLKPQIRRVYGMKGSRILKKPILRSYPQQPTLAMASHQLRRECLSTFYGCNRFALVKNSLQPFRNLNMTEPAVMQQWKPRGGMAAFLTHVELRFSAITSIDRPMWLAYVLRRPLSGDFTADLQLMELRLLTDENSKPAVPSPHTPTETTAFCICLEADIVPLLYTAIAAKKCGNDLIDVADFLVRARLLHLQSSSDVISINSTTYKPRPLVCQKCNKGQVYAVNTGF